MNRITLFLASFLLVQLSMAQSDMIANVDYNQAVEFHNTAKMQYENDDFNSAISSFSNAIRLNPNSSDYPFGLASSYYEIQQYDSAKKYIELAISLEPNQPDYHYRAGNIYFHTKEYEKAFENYTISLANLSDDYPIDLGNCYYNKAVSAYYLERYNRAIYDVTQLLKEKPDDLNALHLRGVSQLKIESNSQACRDLKRANDMGNPNSLRYIKKYCE
ncbi:MAG: tetratricopeptide repeat protein [Cyclobacteriaceae bacterium]